MKNFQKFVKTCKKNAENSKICGKKILESYWLKPPKNYIFCCMEKSKKNMLVKTGYSTHHKKIIKLYFLKDVRLGIAQFWQ